MLGFRTRNQRSPDRSANYGDDPTTPGGKGSFVEPPVLSPEDRATLDLIKRRYTSSKDAKLAMLRTWATSLAFYVGEHYRNWDPRARRLVENKRIPPWRVQLSDNQIPGIVTIGAAKLSSVRQLPRALPNTGEPEDELAAEAGTKVLEHWWNVDGMDAKELDANVQRIIFGTSFFHDVWDSTKVAKLPKPDWQNPVHDPDLGVPMPKITPVPAPVGDVTVEVLSVFDVFPEPVEKWDEVSWVILARRKPLHWFRDTFKGVGRLVRKEQAGGDQDVFQSLMPGSPIHETNEAPPGSAEADGMATLLVYYERPCPKWPEGRHWMLAGDVVLFNRNKLPLPHLEIPVVPFEYQRVPKRLWAMGSVEQVLGLQRELNRSQSNLAEMLRLYRSPKVLVNETAQMDRDAWTSEAGEVVKWKGVVPPQVVPPVALANWLVEFPERMRSAIQQVSGQHEVTNASSPTGVTAGVAISMLQQQDQQRLGPPNIYGKDALQTLALHVLKNIVTLYREPRLILTYGKDSANKFLALAGADIGDRDVLVEIGDGVSDTPAARRQRLIDYVGSGVLPPPLPMPLIKRLFHETGDQWIVSAMDESQEEVQQEQAAQAQQQEAQQQKMLQQGFGPDGKPLPAGNTPADAAATMQQTAQQQQGQLMLQQAQQQADHGHQLVQTMAKQDHEAGQAELDRAHELALAREKAQAQVAAAKARPKPTAGGAKR